MRRDPREPILVSTLRPNEYSFEGERRFVVCGSCRTWRRVRKGSLWPHEGPDGEPCSQSRRRVWFDLTPQQLRDARDALHDAEHHTQARRPPAAGRAPRLARLPRLADRDARSGAAGRPADWR